MSELRESWPTAQANGIEYNTYYARIRRGMSAEVAATRPLSKMGAKPKPDSISRLCKRNRVGRQTFYDEREVMMDESGRLPKPGEVIEAIQQRRGGV